MISNATETKRRGCADEWQRPRRDGICGQFIRVPEGLFGYLPEMVLTSEDYLMLQRFWEHGQQSELTMNVKSTLYTDDLTGYNVIAEIPGSDLVLNKEVVMLGAHLDSWTGGTGATDNGAGCLVMLEVMRILKTLDLQPKRTIRLALWGGEEQILLGSVGYVKKHFADPADMQLKPEQSLISAYYNLDNGTGRIREIYLQGNEKARGKLTEWFKPFNSMGAATISNSYSGGLDQLSLDAAGIRRSPLSRTRWIMIPVPTTAIWMFTTACRCPTSGNAPPWWHPLFTILRMIRQ